jgi:hypothetical protein
MRWLEMQVTLGAQRPAERPRLGHIVSLDELDVAEELLAARLQAGGHDFAADKHALETKIGRAVTVAQPLRDQLAEI